MQEIKRAPKYMRKGLSNGTLHNMREVGPRETREALELSFLD
jgi:hypothetical protein